MIDKRCDDVAAAVRDVKDGACVLIGGFGEAGNPTELVHALIDQGARELIIVNNNSGAGDVGLSRLIGLRRVRRLVCSFPRNAYERGFTEEFRAGRIELELVPQGTLVERIRAGGAGVAAFYTPTGADTVLAEGKETRLFNGRLHVLEHAIRGEFAFIKADKADRWGNLVYRKAARNYGPIMATAADVTVVQVRRTVELGELDPEAIVTPSIFVHRVVTIPNPIVEREYLAKLAGQSAS